MKRNNARNQLGAMTDDGVRFSLFAPTVHRVAIQGSWNNFEPVPMAKATNGVWWISFPLSDGEYQYRFEVTPKAKQDSVLVADPTGMRFAPDTFENSVVEIVNGQPVYFSYRWQHDDVDLAPNEKLIIYEMHIGDFCGGEGDGDNAAGTFERLLAKLDYLHDLGITAIEFMPVTQAEPEDNWGYSQYSIYGVDHGYGTPDELARLVDECHKRGIRVIHDGVYNHLHDNAPLAKIDFEYWFYKVNPDKPELHFGPKFNYEFYDKSLRLYPAREHVLGAIHRWIGTFHMDGIRFDATRALRNFDVMDWFNEEAHHRSGFKPFFTIAEHMPQDPSITGPDGPLDAAWNDNFYRQLNCTVLGIPLDDRQPFNTTEVLRLLDAKSEGFASNYNAVRYLNNHDQERTMYLLGKEAGVVDDAAFRRNKLGASLLLTAPGIPMLWMGEEFGQANKRSEHTERQPLDWSLLNHERNRDLWEHYRRLIALRLESAALCSDNFAPVLDNPERGLIAFKRWDDSGSVFVVVANLKDQDAGEFDIALEGMEASLWREVLHNYEVRVQSNRLIDSLARSEVKIYMKC